MFKDDLDLMAEVVAKWGPLPTPVVEVGGLEAPTIADYSKTIAAMETVRGRTYSRFEDGEADIAAAQRARYIQRHRPLEEWAPRYVIDNPETGGGAVETFDQRHKELGSVLCFSTLEHVENPWVAVEAIHDAMRPGGLCVVSVPFLFPYHPSPQDRWRFSPDGLRALFREQEWEVLYVDWRLRIPASAGVLDIRTGEPQAIESCALVARCK